MASYFISKVTLNPELTVRELLQLKLLGAGGYRDHEIVWGLVSNPNQKERNFIYRVGRTQEEVPSYLIVSEQRIQPDPRVWLTEVRSYHPLFEKGRELQFLVRVNPVKVVSENGQGQERHRRVDCILDARRRLIAHAQQTQTEVARLNDLAAHEGIRDWLHRRQERSGFQIVADSLLVERYEQVAHPKAEVTKHQYQQPDFMLSQCDVSGVLSVTEPELLLKTLTQGLGRGKAWGCGLLLVK